MRQAFPFEFGIKMTGRDHRVKRAKIDIKKAMEMYAFVEEMEKKSTAKYVEILLPGVKLKLKFEKKVQICFCRKASPSGESGMVLLEFDTLERAKYILYARKKEACVYKVPKSEIVVKKAVQKYEKYVEEMRDKLIKAYAEKGAERIIAESLAGQVFEEIGLGNIAVGNP